MATDPHHDNDAERIVLGAAMLNARVLAEVDLNPEDFYRPAHRLLWSQLIDTYAAGEPTDAAAMVARLVDAGCISKVGGAAYLADLTAAVPTVANARHYAGRVRELARRRHLVLVSTQLGEAARNGTDADSAMAQARGLLDEGAASTWADPEPLTGQVPNLPGFPVDTLPDWLADHVRAVAEFNQVPADLPACLALACLSTAAGGKVLLEPKPGWTEPVNIFTVVAMPPGTRKTPVFRTMTRPIKDAEKALKELMLPVIVKARTELKAAQAAADKAANKIPAGADPDTINSAVIDATEAQMRAESIVVPPVPELIADDITPETAASMMADQGGRIAVLAPEGGIVGTLAGRYSGAPNFDVFLRGHGGDDMRVGRKSRDREEIERAALTMGLCLQPGVLRELHRIPGAADKGLLARILYSLPANNVGYRNTDPDPVPDTIADPYYTKLRDLTVTLAGITEHHTIPFSPEARAALTALQAEVEPRLRPDGQWAHIVEWGNKFVGSVVGRLAGLLHVAEHLADGWRRPISLDTVRRAMRIGQYFATHALAAFDAMGADPLTGHADTALRWITRNARPQFAKRELWRAIYRGRFSKVDELDPVLDLLEQHGFVRRLPDPDRPGKGRKPSPRYMVHPTITRPELKAVPDIGTAGTA